MDFHLQTTQPSLIQKLRRILLLVLVLALLAAGAYSLSLQLACLFGLRPECSVRGFGLMAAGFMSVIGGYLLWEEFLRGWLLKRADETSA